MIRLVRDFRLLPLVLIAAGSLLALKSVGLLSGEGYILGRAALEDRQPATVPDPADDIVGSIAAPAKSEPPVADPAIRQSWAQEMFNFPDITGSVGGGDKKSAASAPADASKPSGQAAAKHEDAAGAQVRTAAKSVGDKPAPATEPRSVSASERAILERLQDRRRDLETRARQLDMRESLLKAAEKQLDSRITELKQVEERIKSAGDKQDEAASARFKGLIAMYENMKAKDAARIFDRLDLKVLVEVAGHINPRRMSDILANMSPEGAERLTVEFASRGNSPKAPSPTELPKIEGRPTGP
jgi:flagellar motility protein MotE (MotC chaperone)